MRCLILFSSALIPLVLLTACGPSDSDPGPGGVTVGEAKALNEAAAMLEERRLPAEALPSQAEASASSSPTTSATGEKR